MKRRFGDRAMNAARRLSNSIMTSTGCDRPCETTTLTWHLLVTNDRARLRNKRRSDEWESSRDVRPMLVGPSSLSSGLLARSARPCGLSTFLLCRTADTTCKSKYLGARGVRIPQGAWQVKSRLGVWWCGGGRVAGGHATAEESSGDGRTWSAPTSRPQRVRPPSVPRIPRSRSTPRRALTASR